MYLSINLYGQICFKTIKVKDIDIIWVLLTVPTPSPLGEGREGGK